MSKADGAIQSDPLFVGLTRPTMIFGVSIHFAVLNMMACVVYFLQSTNIGILFLGAILHGIGYVICFKEPKFIELYLCKLGNFNKCPNKIYHGGNSYDL